MPGLTLSYSMVTVRTTCINNMKYAIASLIFNEFHTNFIFVVPCIVTLNKIQRGATVCRCLFIAKLLYMFRASIAPIIRSTSNCNCSF